MINILSFIKVIILMINWAQSIKLILFYLYFIFHIFIYINKNKIKNFIYKKWKNMFMNKK